MPIIDFMVDMIIGIAGSAEVFVSDAIHKAVISVDEKGTEAAAATGMMRKSCSRVKSRLPPVTFHVDQPCSFFIFVRGQNPLFAGRLNDCNLARVSSGNLCLLL